MSVSAVSGSLDLSEKKARYHLVTAGANELILVWDGQRHLANVANGDALMFCRDDDSGWRIAEGALRSIKDSPNG